MIIALLVLVLASVIFALVSAVLLAAMLLIVIFLIDELDKRCTCHRHHLGYEHKLDGSCCAQKRYNK